MHKDNNLWLEITQPEDDAESNIKVPLWPFGLFLITIVIWNMWPQRIGFFIGLQFALAVPKLQTELLCLTSNVSINRQSNFSALVFLLDKYVLGVIRMLLVHPSGVETISASIISLYWYWSSHLPVVLYNLFIFYRHIFL